MTNHSKSQLRKLARGTLAKLSPDDLKQRSALLTQHLVQHLKNHHPEALRIATFAALPHEPDLSLLHPLLPKLQLCYPLVNDNHTLTFHLVSDPTTLQPGFANILEPVPLKHPPILPEELHLILVPGLAFDVQGNRLGQGAGHYDRFLHHIPLTPRLGITFASQLLPQLPTEPHDVAMNELLSDQGACTINRI